MSNTIIIDKNGNKKIFGSLKNMVISNGKITVDGKPLEELERGIDPNEKLINITITGDIERLDIDYCQTIHVTGNSKRVKTNNGDIHIGGDVEGDVHTNMGSITCGKVEGDCHTNMGSIYKR